MKVQISADGRAVVATPTHEVPRIPYDGSRRCENWISSFLEYTDIVDVPVNFLRWAALSTLAGAAQRKIYFDMGHFEIYSNMFVVLVGPPGTKKSTAIRAGKRLLKKVPAVYYTSDAPSVPGVMEEFKEIVNKSPSHQSLNAFILELSTLYENAKESMDEFLTAMYDCDEDYIKRTRIGGKEHIPAPWLNLCAGTTPSFIGRNVGDTELEGGLEARKINVYSNLRLLNNPRPKFTARHKKLQEDLIHDLARISTVEGAFDFEGGEEGIAYQWYDNWYRGDVHHPGLYKRAAEIEAKAGYRNLQTHPAEARFPRLTDYRIDGYYNRKHIHILKVAMAVSLAAKDELVVSFHDLMIAKALLESIETDMSKVYSAVGGNKYMTDIERIQQSLKDAGQGGLLYSEILSAHLHSMEQRFILDALDCLVKMGDAVKMPDMQARPPEHRFIAL